MKRGSTQETARNGLGDDERVDPIDQRSGADVDGPGDEPAQ